MKGLDLDQFALMYDCVCDQLYEERELDPDSDQVERLQSLVDSLDEIDPRDG